MADALANNNSFPQTFCAQEWSILDVFSISKQEDLQIWNDLILQFSDPLGHPLLRAEIASLYWRHTEENIVCFSHLSEVVEAIQSLAEGAPQVLFTTPAPPNLRRHWRKVSPFFEVSLWNEQNTQFDFEPLLAAMSPSVQAVLLSSPLFPAGTWMPLDVLENVVARAREQNIYLVSDERAYWLRPNLGGNPPQPMTNLYENGLSIGSMDQSFGMPGLNIYWIASQNTSILKQLTAFKQKQGNGLSTPSETIACLALRSKELLLKCNQSIISQNLQILEQSFQTPSACSWIRPQAGCSALLRFASTEHQDICLRQWPHFSEFYLPAHALGSTNHASWGALAIAHPILRNHWAGWQRLWPSLPWNQAP